MGKYKLNRTISEKHKALVRHFFECDFNKREACRRAGYPISYTSEVFKHPDVLDEIARRRSKTTEQFELSREWIVKRLMMLADSNLMLAKFKRIDEDGDLYWDFTGATPEELAVIQEITTDFYVEGKGPDARKIKKVKIKVSDPKAALDSLARIQGIYNDTVKVEGQVDIIQKLQARRNKLAADKRGPTDE